MQTTDVLASLAAELTDDQMRRVRDAIDMTADGAYADRERTIDALAAHMPTQPVRAVAEHIYDVEAGGAGACELCEAGE